jgi:hypothetical protein
MLTKCIEWPHARTTAGYGKLSIGGKKWEAHRRIWYIRHGPIPKGMCVCHKCDNPACINLDHLFLGTQGDNIRDCYAKGRRKPPSKPAITEQTAVKIKLLSGDLSYRQMAITLGVSASYIRNIALGKRFPHITANTRYSI